MVLAINPLVDFAFKMLFGSPDHTAITISFLNAVLQPTPRIQSVEILNPILGKETDVDKLPVLDILATDEHQRQFNIEVQTTLPAGLAKRLAYYASRLYTGQISEGDSYTKLKPAICICVLAKSLFPDRPEMHLDFRLRETNGQILSDDLQVHLIELPKSTSNDHNLEEVSLLERWAYFLRFAENADLDDLRTMFPQPEFMEAIGVLEMIRRDPDEKLLYEARLKYRRDEAARMEAAVEAGRESARMELEKAKAAVEVAAAEALDKGELIGEIRLLQKLLKRNPSEKSELVQLAHEQLSAMVRELEQELNQKNS